VSHALVTRRRFDVCVVDEAGQLTEPVCLGPLRRADSFVLVGDHHQLQPVVRARTARDEGMMVSLFERLCVAHPAAVRRLSRQYRMAGDIMLLANALVYKGALQCGAPAVSEVRTLPRCAMRFRYECVGTDRECWRCRCWMHSCP
jgi:DNA replication ATP-dependent helicase Dna2